LFYRLAAGVAKLIFRPAATADAVPALQAIRSFFDRLLTQIAHANSHTTPVYPSGTGANCAKVTIAAQNNAVLHFKTQFSLRRSSMSGDGRTTPLRKECQWFYKSMTGGLTCNPPNKDRPVGRGGIMKLHAPALWLFVVSLIIAVIAVVGVFTPIPFVTMYAFWVAILAYIVLAVGNVVEI
jgi:hypothetical protein